MFPGGDPALARWVLDTTPNTLTDIRGELARKSRSPRERFCWWYVAREQPDLNPKCKGTALDPAAEGRMCHCPPGGMNFGVWPPRGEQGRRC